MLDAIPVMSIAAAAIAGWIFCMMNPRVFWLWKIAGPPAVLILVLYVVFALLGGTATRMELWSGIQMDRAILAVALAPILVWPMRSPKKQATQPVAAGLG